MKRRDFLAGSAGLAGTLVPFLSRGAGNPCPPPSLSVSGGTSAISSCATDSGTVTSLTLVGSGNNLPWTIGQAFRRGDVPSSWFVGSDETSFQASVRNRWSDGSVKFAVLSGQSSLAGSKVISVTRAQTAPPGSNVAEPTSLDLSVAFSGQVAGTYTLQSCLGVDRSSWSKSAAGRVRQFPGPVMSEFHYYCPTSDAHVCIWFYVRRYASGATEIETVVENGWLNVASPGEKDYSVTISVGGSARYSGAIKHYHHSRWSRVDWIGADPAVTAQHAVAYLRSTRLVPNYGTKFGTPTTAAFTPYAQASTPMGIGNWRADFTGTGDGDTDQIGPLPPWEALYFTTADSRAFNATVANARMAGSHPAHYRDETTGRPLRFSQHPTKSLQNGTLPSATGGSASTIDLAHGAAMGYVAYLVTGRWSFMEEAQLWATWNYLILDAGARGNSAGRFWGQQVRGVAWGLRQLALAATITSDGDATLKSDLTAGYDANILYMYDNAVNPAGPYYTVLGVVTPPRLDSDDATGNGYLDAKNWQHDFLAVSLGWASDLEFSSSPYLTAVRDHAYRFTIGRLGTTTYNYRRAGAYQVPVATPENWVSSGSAYLSSWTAVYAALKASQGLADVPSTSGLSMLDGSTAIEAYRWTMSYTGQAMAACVYAVDHGATGASASYALLTASSSWPLTSAFANSPKWGLVPR